MDRGSRDRYDAFTMSLHWLTVLLLIAVYALIELRGLAPKGSALHDGMMAWHFTLGLTVWGVVLLRLGVRVLLPPPPIVPEPPRWQLALAGLMHVALYAFLVLMPLLGWLTLSAKGGAIPLFWWNLPALVGPDKPLATSLQNIHETVGTLGYYLIGLHAAAALFHHYVMRDNTLIRMLPRLGGRGTRRVLRAGR